MIPVLEIERLRLRGWQRGDFDAYAAFRADPEMAGRLPGGPLDRTASWNKLCETIGQWTLRGYGIFALEERESGHLAGYSGLWHPVDLEEPELTWGLFAGFHGRGYATEAARAVQHWAHEEAGLPPLMSFVHPDNTPSIRVAERLGATLERRGKLRGLDRLVYRHVVPSFEPIT